MSEIELKSHRGGRVESMPWKKRLQVWLLCWVAYIFIRLLYASLRFEVVGAEHRKKAESLHPNGSLAIATWHQNSILGITGHAKQGICIIISASIDGEIISWIANKLGLKSIRGSSSRGGREALLALVRYVRQGGRVAFTVDGPRGPRHEVKPGILSLAKKTSCPILPMGAIAERYWSLSKTWDHFRIPKPFSRVRVYYKEPIMLASDGDQALIIDDAKQRLTQALHAIEDEAAKKEFND
ncbi:MAG: lysophospholipid acyltransferase family protein [Oligoflexus sp.]